MSGYTKLFSSILESTVWLEPPPIKVVWITLMAMADRDGIVEASVPGLTKRAGVERDQCEQALTVFLSPDPDSRTTDNEGRRIEAVQGGWRLLNYEAYRQRASAEEAKTKAAERKRRQRARQKAAVTPDVTPETGQSVTSVTVTGRPPIAPAPAPAPAKAEIPNLKVSVVSNASASTKETMALSKPPNGNGHARKPDTRSKRPIFTGQRLTVFEWFLDKAEQVLGEKHYMAFDIHEWFFALDKNAAAANIVIPQRDNGAWLEQQLIAEAGRRGLPIAVTTKTKETLSTRMTAMVQKARAGGAH